MVKVVSLYNHKGGVSKTTTVFNLAHFLAEQGKKVLVVDADPQCNATELLMASKINQLDEESADSDIIKDLPGKTLLEVLKPRLDGDVPEVEINNEDAVSINENLFLIRGDVSLSLIEDQLSEAHSQRFSEKIHQKRNYIAINSFVRRFAEDNYIDFVLFDVGPSSGAITRFCFLSCDFFFVPCVPDRFNVQAISTLSSILDTWMKEHGQIVSDFEELGLLVPHGKPKFCGVILQNYKVSKGVPKRTYQFWMDKIPDKVENVLLPVLSKYSTDERDLVSDVKVHSIVVSEIADFAGLSPIMQASGRAIFQISQSDTELVGPRHQGVTWTQTQERKDMYKQKISQLADRVLSWS